MIADEAYHIFTSSCAPTVMKTKFWVAKGTNNDSFKYGGHTDTLN
jgi:hypothetical protein